MIDKQKLQVDPSYQRPRKPEVIRKIRAHFDPIAFHALSVVDRGEGLFYIIDGQQRHAAVLDRPEITEVPCLIYKRDDLKLEASHFLVVNTIRKAVTPLEKFHARVTSGDARAIEIYEFARKEGYQVVDHGHENVGCIRCIQAIESSWKKDSEAFQKVWPTLRTMCRAKPIVAQLLKALFQIQIEGSFDQEFSDYWSSKGVAEAVLTMDAYCHKVRKSNAKNWAEAMLRDFKDYKRAKKKSGNAAIK